MKTNMNIFICILIFSFLALTPASGKVYRMDSYGVRPGAKNIAEKTRKALTKIKSQVKQGEETTISFLPGKYDFNPDDAAKKEYYISNHDQSDYKITGIAIEDWENLTVDGNGAEFIFYGTMLPVSLVRCSDCTLKNFSIDFANPHIAQVEIVRNEGKGGMVIRPSDEVKYRINEEGKFETFGEGWTQAPFTGIAFDSKSRHILPNTSDLWCNTSDIKEIGEGLLYAPEWIDERLAAGTYVAMRTYDRPAPGVFLSESKNTEVRDVTVHYAFGMGMLAQLCENITLDGFKVISSSGRYFTTQADATHFSQCKGKILSQGGVYEGMMDDAINIHGIYLRIKEIKDSRTIKAEFAHYQAWGFDWGFPGDSVRFVKPDTMEEIERQYNIVSILPVSDSKVTGVKEFEIRLSEDIEEGTVAEEYGIENLSWTPEVLFSGNLVRNNRARGALFSSPAKTVVEDNVFDHTSGSAILLCGDCNGWFESGACRDITIRKNKFINALTSKYQFTSAVISIYPEIPDIRNQKKYFHGGKPGSINITDNEFITFGTPLLYAKSTDGLVFKDNTVILNNDFEKQEDCRTVILENTGRIEIGGTDGGVQ